jgi:hypothetical protein
MSTKGHGLSSSKKNKHKTRQNESITNSSTAGAVITSQTQESGDSTSIQSSVSLSNLHHRHGSMSSSNILNQEVSECPPGLEDLDLDDYTPTQSRLLSKKQRQQIQQQLSQQQHKAIPSEEVRRSDFWTWITASRVALEQQPPLPKESHLKKPPGKGHQDGIKVDATEAEKKLALHSWDKVEAMQSFNLTSRDWIALSAITVATVGVRVWRISWPDEVV